MADSQKKVTVYIDGSNFYFSIKNTFKCKIDIEKFCNQLVGRDNLIKIGYYISPVIQASNPEMYAEQQSFFYKLEKINKLKIVLGRLEKHKQDGKTFYVEKATDINLALDLILDAVDNKYDKAFLISNDGDFSGAVSAAIERFNKEIVYVAVGNKRMISHHLKKISSSTFIIDNKFIDKVRL
jgi:uncharacterized LabA/DUF88 family protein